MHLKSLFIIVGLLLITSALVSGCASSRITSNKAPDYSDKLSKVYLLMRCSKGAREFSYTFKTSLLQALEEKGVQSDYYIVDPLALETEKDIEARVEKYAPKALLLITQTESKTHSSYNWGTSGNITGATFDVKIVLPGSGKIVWRASLEASGSHGVDMAVRKTVKTLLDKLAADRLI